MYEVENILLSIYKRTCTLINAPFRGISSDYIFCYQFYFIFLP